MSQVQGISAIHFLPSAKHNLRLLASYDRAHRNVCFPSRTTVIWNSRTCTWTQWSQFRASGSSESLLQYSRRHIYRTLDPLACIAALPIRLRYSPLNHQNRLIYTWNTNSKLAWTLHIFAGLDSKDPLDLLAMDAYQSPHAWRDLKISFWHPLQ